jgi:diaminopimelate epimerase
MMAGMATPSDSAAAQSSDPPPPLDLARPLDLASLLPPGLAFVKGHGTGNDFVIIADLDGSVDLSAEQVAALCDRRRGIGADGLLRVVRTTHVPDLITDSNGAAVDWFMDYRNADGSLVFARYLVFAGLAAGPTVPFLTRAGIVTATVGPDEVSVTMPRVSVGGPGVVRFAGGELKGTAATCGNPNLVCFVDDPATLDLTGPLELDDAQFPAGANVEFVTPVSADHVRMRVVERGVGETLSCGSGACAVAGVVLSGRPGVVTVDVPGGRLTVTIAEDGSCRLAGPAVLVATGTVLS